MSDKMVEFQSKMLVAFLKAFKVDPSVDGLIQAVGGEPTDVYEAVKLAQETAPVIAETVKSLHANLPVILRMIAETHAMQLENNQMLRALCDKAGIPAPRMIDLPALASDA
jgi:hypothetical protein